MAPVASKVVKAWSWWTFGATDFGARKWKMADLKSIGFNEGL